MSKKTSSYVWGSKSTDSAWLSWSDWEVKRVPPWHWPPTYPTAENTKRPKLDTADRPQEDSRHDSATPDTSSTPPPVTVESGEKGTNDSSEEGTEWDASAEPA
jgi:hypothetical protein